MRGQRGQPFPHTSTHCCPDKCSITRHSWQLHFHFRDFSGGLCQVMKTTTAESNPDMTVLLQQTPCFSPKVLATDKMASMSWLQTTRWQPCPGYRQDGNHVMATDKMAIMSWLQTRWQPCPGYRQDSNHVLTTDKKIATMS